MPVTMPRIGQSPTLMVETTRRRETPREVGGFGEMLRKGGRLLLAGAEVAGSLVGGPMLSAAVARLRTGADSLGSTAASPTGAAGAGVSNGGSTVDSLRAMQNERMSEELQLIALQSDVQRQDRQVSLTSNLLKAQHDTAKAAISNIRA